MEGDTDKLPSVTCDKPPDGATSAEGGQFEIENREAGNLPIQWVWERCAPASAKH